MSSNQPGLGHQANTSLSLASKKDRNRLGDGEGREIRAECQQIRASEAEPSRGTPLSAARGSPGSMSLNSPTAWGGVSAAVGTMRLRAHEAVGAELET